MMCKLLRYLTEGAGHDLEPLCWKNNTLRHQFDTVVFMHRLPQQCMKPGQLALDALVRSWLC